MGLVFNKEQIDKIRFKHDNSSSGNDEFSRAVENNRIVLLAKAIKITKELSPTIYSAVKIVEEFYCELCKIELFVINNSEINAYTFGGNNKIAYVVLTSSLVKLLSKEEIVFIISHEVAHYIFGHTKCINKKLPNKPLNKNNNIDEKFFEISADRLGFLVIDDKTKAYSAIIKLISGLDNTYINPNISEYLSQLNIMKETTSDNMYSYNDSHPIFIARIRALLMFELSEMFYLINNKSSKAPIKNEVMESKIYRDIIQFGSMEDAKSNEMNKHKLEFWVLMLFLMNENLLEKFKGKITKEYGKEYYENGIVLLEREGMDGFKKRIAASVKKVKSTSVISNDEITNMLTDALKRYSKSDTVIKNIIKSLI